MKKSVFGLVTALGYGAAMLMLALAPSAGAQSEDSGNVRTSISKVKTFGGSEVIPYAGSSLARYQTGASTAKRQKGVFGTFYTSGLTPGTVVTLWWAIFNNPENCATRECGPADLANPDVNASLQYAGGRVIGADGSASFGGFLGVGDNTGFEIRPGMPNPAPGLINPKGAAIHLVLRSHGAASSDPAVLNQQLTSFNGGCPPCANLQAAVYLP